MEFLVFAAGMFAGGAVVYLYYGFIKGEVDKMGAPPPAA